MKVSELNQKRKGIYFSFASRALVAGIRVAG
jgi:hypothetical protein